SEIRMFYQDDPVFPFTAKLPAFGDYFIFERRINIINKFQSLLLELQELSGFIIKKRNFNTIKIGKSYAAAVFFKIMLIFFHYQCLAFFPCYKLERPRTTGVTAKIFAIFFHYFFWYNRTILHTHYTQNRMKWTDQF